MDTINTSVATGSTNRFCMTARKMLIENRKTLLIAVGGYLGAMIAIGFWFGWMGMTPSASAFTVYFLIAGLSCSVAASLMFSDMKTKEGRIAVLMSPARACDKFWVRMLAVLPGMFILAIAGWYAYSLAIKVSYGIFEDIWLPLFNPLTLLMGPQKELAFCSFLGVFMFNESLFILGAILWPRKSFLKTLLLQAIISMLFSTVTMLVALLIEKGSYNVEVMNGEALGWIFVAISWIVDAAIIYLAWRRFKRCSILK